MKVQRTEFTKLKRLDQTNQNNPNLRGENKGNYGKSKLINYYSEKKI